MTKIDSFYKVADKSNYYLGMISQVNRAYSTIQIENLSLFSYRKLRTDILAPNTINFYVLIDSSNGLFLVKYFNLRFLTLIVFMRCLRMDNKKKFFQK